MEEVRFMELFIYLYPLKNISSLVLGNVKMFCV